MAFNRYSDNRYELSFKAPLRVLYEKIQHEEGGRVANTALGFASCCICHETPPRVLYFLVQHEYKVLLLICWFCVGGLLLLSSAIRCEELNSTLYEVGLLLKCMLLSIRLTRLQSFNEMNQVVRVIAL